MIETIALVLVITLLTVFTCIGLIGFAARKSTTVRRPQYTRSPRTARRY